MYILYIPLNCMLGTMTFSHILASVLGASNKLLYDGLSATEARNWMALLTNCEIEVKFSLNVLRITK